MWFANEAEEQAIDRLLRELGIRLPEIMLSGDDDSSEPLLDGDADYKWLLDESTEH